MPGIRIDVDTTSSFTNVKNLSRALSDLGKQGIVTESEIKKLTAEFQKKLAAEEAERKAAALGNTLDRVAKSCGMTAGQLADLRTKAGLAASSMADLNRNITLVHSSAAQSTANFANTGNSVDVLAGKVGLLAAGYISLQSAMQAVKSIASMESLRASFAGIFGDNGAEQFKYVIDAANKYGKSIEDTAGAYRKFAAAADYVGMSTENIRKIFEGTSQAITKVGGSSQDVAGALLAISQSISKGQVMSEEFRLQFAERIPGAMKMAANAMGVTAGEFQKLMESGQVLPNEFWPKMADEMSKFSQGWQASSQTLTSDFERMKNALMELGGNDVIQGITKVLGFFTMGTVEESAKRITSIFDDFSTKYKAIMAESRGELSPFESWYTPIDELKKKLDALAARRSEYISGLKTDIDGLTKSLAEAQSKQLDFGPSGENVDVMRQKLKWFQDLLVQLTGQTWTVNVNANVDTSQLKQAQSYIQEIIKGTAEVRGRTIDAEREKLDNAVKILGKNKSDLEAKLASPTTDTWQKGSIGDQIKTINKDLDDAKLGYDELSKQQKKLTEQQIKDNSEVKKFNESRGGVSGSEVTHDTQRIDAERLSIARQTDAWREYQAGLKTLPETYEIVSRAQEAETVTQDKITKAIERESKSRSNGATAAARYAERTFSYLEQAQDQYDQLVAMMGGDTLAAKIAGIEKRYDKAASAIRQAMIGAKGSTAELDATLEKMGQSKALEILMAQAEAWRKSMQDAANLLGEIGRLSGDPSAIYGSEMTTAQLWEADQQKRINAIEDETEREKQLGELRQAMALKEVAARADAYESVKAVSSKYWEAERQRTESNLEIAKREADDELAYKIYAAQQWDEYNKKQLEQQAQTAGTFADTFAARWSLHFGSYEDEMTKTKESWDQMSDSIINSTDGMIDGVAGGFGDMIRNIGNGTASIEDLWKNMLARMLDAFASFVEELIKTKLKDLVGGWFGSTGSQPSVGSGSTGTGGISSLAGESVSSLKKVGTSIAKGITGEFASGGSDASQFINSLSKASATEMAQLAKSPSGYTALTSGASSAGALAKAATSTSSIMGTIGSTLGIIGGVAGLVGLAVSIFGQKEEEVRKTASGYNVMYSGGKTVTSGVDFYSDGSVVGTGVGDPDVTKKISDAFKEAAENLSDFADVLGFTVDVLDGFTMPAMNITDDQIDTYIRNGSNAMAFQALEQAGLRGAFDMLAEDGEVYIDEVERLSDAYSTGASKLSAYGYDMADVAQVTQDQIDALREQTVETAAGTSQAILTMASSMGATSDQLALLAANASDGSQALAVTDEQLTNFLTADWVSKVEDQVGGEDAFNSIMDNLLGNVFDTIDAYANNLDYYNEKASKYISQLGDDTITVENFWEKFNAALKEGMDPETFEPWGKASSWVNSIDSVNEALDDWNEGMKEAYDSLEARLQKAQGYDTQAEITNQLISAEKELYEARKAGYEAAYIAKLQEVQAAEMAALEAKNAKEAWNTLEDLAVREKKAAGDPYADASSAYFAAQWEYKTAQESGLYNANDLARLKAVQEKEIQNYYDDIAESIEKNASDAHSKLLRALGQTDAADLYDKQIEMTSALADALKSNLYTAEAYAELVQAYTLEVQNLIEQQARDAEDYANSIASRLLSASGQKRAAQLLDQQVQGEDDLYEARQKGLEGTQLYADLERAIALERASLIAQLDAEQAKIEADLNARMLRAQGLDYEASLAEAAAAAESELADARQNGYDEITLATIVAVQYAEKIKLINDHMEELKSAWADLTSREYAVAGDDPMSKWTALVEQQRQEYLDAYKNGYGEEYLQKLLEIQKGEREQQWAEWQEDAWQERMDDLNEQISDLKDTLSDTVDKLQDAMDSFGDVLSQALSDASSLYSDAQSARKALESTLSEITTGDLSPLSNAEKASSLYGKIQTAYEQMTTAGRGSARIDAANTIQDIASEYLQALQASGGSEEYLAGYIDTVQKLNEAKNIAGQDENYYLRYENLLTAEQKIMQAILDELGKQTPDIQKLQGLQKASEATQVGIQDLYGDVENHEQSWRRSVEAALAGSGQSQDEIASILGSGGSINSLLASMQSFNSTTMPQYIQTIVGLLQDIENVAGGLTDTPPDVPVPDDPEPPNPGGDTWTDEQIALATNLRDLMSYANYGGSSSWTTDLILPSLDKYASWGSSFGVDATHAFSLPTDSITRYQYEKMAQLNKTDSKTDWTYLDVQNQLAKTYGSANNTLAHFLGAGYNEGITYPSSDLVAKKTSTYFWDKWLNDSAGASSPLQLAQMIANAMGISYTSSNMTNAVLESIAKSHWDTYLKNTPESLRDVGDRGLVQPYALGGIAAAGTFGLVGEEGPELVQFGDTTRITPHNDSLSLLGDSYSVVIKELKEEIKKLRAQVEYNGRALREITQHTKTTKEYTEQGMTVGFPTKAVA